MGANLGEHLAFGPVIEGEHTLGKYLRFFTARGLICFAGTTVLNADQGLVWMPSESVGLSSDIASYLRPCAIEAPQVGLLLHFNVPKLPFIFPSIG